MIGFIGHIVARLVPNQVGNEMDIPSGRRFPFWFTDILYILYW